MEMLFIYRKETDPYFNIAAEEYLLKNFREDIFSMWINDPCIVVGKHQNALAEINYWFAREKGIPVIRRISGGGTVYQDRGNLNFSFIISGEKGKLVNYRKYTEPVISFLRTLEIQSEFEGKSNLVVQGLKFSGNSAHIYRDKVIHHGTILFSSDLQTLECALTRGNLHYEDKSVRSISKKVTNISDQLSSKMSMEDFSDAFFEYILNISTHVSIFNLTDHDQEEIRKLADEKCKKWEWNFGYSPDYSFRSEFDLPGKRLEMNILVSKGIIKEAEIKDDSGNLMPELKSLLTGLQHREETIREKLNNVNFADKFGNNYTEEFIHHLF